MILKVWWLSHQTFYFIAIATIFGRRQGKTGISYIPHPCPMWLPLWDNFITFRWIDSIKYPGVMVEQVKELLSVLG